MNKKQRERDRERDRVIAQKLGMTQGEIDYIRGSRSKICMNFKRTFSLHRDLDDLSTFAYCRMYLRAIRDVMETEDLLDKAIDSQIEQEMDHSEDIDALEERGDQLWN